MVQYGQSSLEAWEERLGSIGRHNLQVGGLAEVEPGGLGCLAPGLCFCQ